MLWLFQNGFFFSPPARNLRFFSCIDYGNLVEFLVVNLTVLWGPLQDWVPLASLALRAVRTEPPAIPLLQFRLSYPGTGSHGGSCLGVSALVNCDSLYSPFGLSHLGGSVLLHALPSSKDSRRVVDFSVCLVFYLLLGQTGNLQAAYTWNWKTCLRFFMLTMSQQGQCDCAPCGVLFQDGSLIWLANWYLAGASSQGHLVWQDSQVPLHVASLNFLTVGGPGWSGFLHFD